MNINKKEFIEIWKKISNDKRIRPKLVEHKSYYGTTYKTKEKGWLYPEHHILYNLIRGYPANRGFLENSEGFENALNFFKESSSIYKSNLMFEPFKEHLSKEQYSNLLLEYKL